MLLYPVGEILCVRLCMVVSMYLFSCLHMLMTLQLVMLGFIYV